MTRRPSRRELANSIEDLQEETGAGDPLAEDPGEWPIPDGAAIPTEIVEASTEGTETVAEACERRLAGEREE